jgi:hypothetical protein
MYNNTQGLALLLSSLLPSLPFPPQAAESPSLSQSQQLQPQQRLPRFRLLDLSDNADGMVFEDCTATGTNKYDLVKHASI